MDEECLLDHFVIFAGLDCSAWMKVGLEIVEGREQLVSHQVQGLKKIVLHFLLGEKRLILHFCLTSHKIKDFKIFKE